MIGLKSKYYRWIGKSQEQGGWIVWVSVIVAEILTLYYRVIIRCMELKRKTTEEVVLIRYYNVLFYLVFKGGIDDFNRQCLVNRINTGESIRMKQIQKWCHYHQITYRTRFIYRKDFPLKANLWNLYSYIRFLLENR